MNLHISHLQAGEETALVRIHNSAFSEWATQLPACYRYQPLRVEQVRDWLQQPLQTIWAIRLSGDVIGYAACRQTTLSNVDKTAILHFSVTHEDWGQSRIAVVPEFQEQGIATKLLQTILADFADKGGQLVTAYGYSFNPAATRLFSKLGFVNRERFTFAPYSDREPFTYDSIFAQLDLTEPLPNLPLNHELTVRTVQDGDMGAIQRIFRESASFAYEGEPSEQQLVEWLSNENADIRLVAEVNGDVVGLMECYRDGVIGIPGILPPYRKRGVGTTLFEHLLRAMQRAKYPLAVGDTGLIQHEMMRLYERFGFDCSRRLLNWVRDCEQSD
ncbi:GNAT family N-acetyltransferase [Chloroflexi bacterium TSY]|nr:GNAT family N-acetyltransferase [Chloroflexi bacterium TSY]